ncbi:hypothetical protein V6N12_045146 [Hibiscus sabdariffa]|uniref:Uncharacterized protein n=1 Tax=Hibiscus sabdariffa TaxID=183260 RepID=A0ABR2G246_9ROSI
MLLRLFKVRLKLRLRVREQVLLRLLKVRLKLILRVREQVLLRMLKVRLKLFLRVGLHMILWVRPKVSKVQTEGATNIETDFVFDIEDSSDIEGLRFIFTRMDEYGSEDDDEIRKIGDDCLKFFEKKKHKTLSNDDVGVESAFNFGETDESSNLNATRDDIVEGKASSSSVNSLEATFQAFIAKIDVFIGKTDTSYMSWKCSNPQEQSNSIKAMIAWMDVEIKSRAELVRNVENYGRQISKALNNMSQQ